MVSISLQDTADSAPIVTRDSPTYSPETLAAELEALHARYPEETRLSVYGTSCLGQPLYAMEIGNPEATTRVLVQAGMHGREWINVQILMAQIEDYLAKDMYDPMLERASFLFVPMSNPDGVRIAQLDEMSYRRLLWNHRPLTDFWRIGKGISQKLEAMRLFTMGDVARASLDPYCEDRLYKTFGVNAELIIDHAWGWEPVTVEDIRQYRPSTSSISSGQVLQCPYDFEKGRLIVREMTELLVLDLVRKHVVTKQIVLDIGYDRESLEGERGRKYAGPVVTDPYGRKIPKAAHGTGNMDGYTSSTHVIMSAVLDVYDRVVHKDLLIRRVNVTACNLVSETEIPEEKPEQLDMFTDYEALKQEKKARQLAEEKERRLQNVTLAIQDRYGKNAMLKGMNLMEGGTTIARNGQIGGHKAGEE